MPQDIDYFTTYDIYLSTVLLTFGEQLAEIQRNPSGKSLFCFHKRDSLDFLVKKYWAQELKVCPQDLFYSFKQIKNRLYSSSY
jgi:hypothetical protein